MSLICKVQPWMEKSFPVIERICLVAIALLCLVMIVLVFMQITDGNGGSNAIMGNQDSYYIKNASVRYRTSMDSIDKTVMIA